MVLKLRLPLSGSYSMGKLPNSAWNFCSYLEILEGTSVLLQSEDQRSGKRSVVEELSMGKPQKTLTCTFFSLVIIYCLGASLKLNVDCRGVTDIVEQRVESTLTSKSCKTLSHQSVYVFLRCERQLKWIPFSLQEQALLRYVLCDNLGELGVWKNIAWYNGKKWTSKNDRRLNFDSCSWRELWIFFFN